LSVSGYDDRFGVIMLSAVRTRLRKFSSHEMLIGSLLAFLVKILGAGSAFLLNIVIARSLGAEQAGYFFLSQAMVMMFVIVGRQGFDNVLIKYIASYAQRHDNETVSGIYSYVIFRVLPLSAVLTVGLWALAEPLSVSVYNKPLLAPCLAMLAFVLLPISLSQIHGFCLQGKKRIVPAMLFNSAALSVLFLVTVFMLKPTDATDAAQSYAICAFVVMVASVIVWNRRKKVVFSSLTCSVKSKLSDTAKPLFAILLMTQITQWSDQLMLGLSDSVENIALLSTANVPRC